MAAVLLPKPRLAASSAKAPRPTKTLRGLSGHGQLLPVVVVAGSTLVSLFYIWFVCPLDLSADEAHYWAWSRHLDWCYYSKGPLTAWLIRVSCELFGGLSITLTGDLAAAVRTPAAFCHGALLLGSYFLSRGVLHSRSTALAIVLVEMALPLMRAGAVLMTIDPPFLACWCWALVCVHKAVCVKREGRSDILWWCGGAVFVCFGTLAKFTMSLLPVAVCGFLLFHRRAAFREKGIWLFFLGAFAGWAPIVWWNGPHNWVSFRHVLGQVGGEGQAVTDGIRWFGPALFLAGQAGVLLLVWLVPFLCGGARFRPSQETDIDLRLMWWSSIPVWFVFAFASFVKYGQLNWPSPAYVSGAVLAGAWLSEMLSGRFRRLVRVGLSVALSVSFLSTAILHFPGLIRPLLTDFLPRPTEAKPLPVRSLDFSARLQGWKTLADEVDCIRNEIRIRDGQEAVLAGTHWTIPGQLCFYCDGHPDTFSVGIPDGTDRHSQYDLWRPNPLVDAQAFRGRTFIIVGDLGLEVRRAFELIEPARRVIHSAQGVPLAAWNVWVCRGFRGFAEPGPECYRVGY
jgi:4-amino-4-deoxy-L-arabinose transferase-like glycosyltransferase